MLVRYTLPEWLKPAQAGAEAEVGASVNFSFSQLTSLSKYESTCRMFSLDQISSYLCPVLALTRWMLCVLIRWSTLFWRVENLSPSSDLRKTVASGKVITNERFSHYGLVITESKGTLNLPKMRCSGKVSHFQTSSFTDHVQLHQIVNWGETDPINIKQLIEIYFEYPDKSRQQIHSYGKQMVPEYQEIFPSHQEISPSDSYLQHSFTSEASMQMSIVNSKYTV